MSSSDYSGGEISLCYGGSTDVSTMRPGYWSTACASGISRVKLGDALKPIIEKRIDAIPPTLSEEQIRTLVRQEIQASGAVSGFKPLLEMTPDQAVVISTAIALLWATAWCFKQVAKFLKEKDYEDS